MGSFQNNPANAIPVYIASAPSGSGIGTKTLNITTATNTQVKTGAGTFLGLSVNTPEAGATATIYNGTSSAGTLLGVFSLAAQTSLTMPGGGYPFTVGLFVVTAGGTPANITVAYA